MATRMELGNQQYVFQDDSGNPAEELLITSHGHYWMGLTGTFTVPAWTTLHFFGPHQASLLDPGVRPISQGMKDYETFGPGSVVRDYTLSKFQGSHGNQAETYASIGTDIDHNRELVATAATAPDDVMAPLRAQGIKFDKFDVLTIRNRRLRTDPNISSVIQLLDQQNLRYANILCSFCRSPAIGPSGTHNARSN